MKLFKNSYEKAYNLDLKINNIIKDIKKNNSSLDEEELRRLIDGFTDWFMNQSNITSTNMYKENDMLKFALEKQEVLLQNFNMNLLLKYLKESSLEHYHNKIVDDDLFRRKILYCTLLNTIKVGGRYKGAEYGLVFSKTFGFDLSIPLHYASYDSRMDNKRLKEYIDTYIELGGSKHVYWLPNYFDNDKKSKYCMEELEYVISYIDNLSKDKSYKKFI